jgi:hypothetical protein
MWSCRYSEPPVDSSTECHMNPQMKRGLTWKQDLGFCPIILTCFPTNISASSASWTITAHFCLNSCPILSLLPWFSPVTPKCQAFQVKNEPSKTQELAGATAKTGTATGWASVLYAKWTLYLIIQAPCSIISNNDCHLGIMCLVW